ncbi:hypothetical protein LTR53_013856 [Teratosphaeriaceae sp. CCFEE 6253]|nr:hypothetical protein LTR53_013856 [Teratosphaeriaceae sp. CCFEE 6253]
MTPDAIPLTWNEAASGITGSISLAAWIFLLLPQLVENYQQGSADGISLTFLFIWFVGDVTNLAGALWAGLVPTVTALAIYFCFADAILIGQCLYYHTRNKRRSEKETAGANGSEHTPLLDGAASPKAARQHSLTDVREDNLGLPGSRRRSSAASSGKARRRTASSAASPPLAGIPEEAAAATNRTYLKNTISVLLILLVGAAGWAIAYRSGAWRPTPTGRTSEDDGPDQDTPLGAELLGYASAVCYLGARLPQIAKNQRERSCDGLSLLFFMLSLLGNATYGAGILFHSVEKRYFMTNLPWLIGSLGTMAEDAVIFVQFSVFGEKEEQAEESAVE